jgi:RNA polymerase sigma-70 factor (ECF subfamily)
MAERPSQYDAGRLEQARAAWPQLELDEGDFVAWLVNRAARGAELHLHDLWLVRACELNLRGALAAFERTALRPALRKLPESVRADVGQRVLQRLFTGASPKIHQYRGQGALVRWLAVVAMREAQKERQVAAREDRSGRVPELAGAIALGELGGIDRGLHRQAKSAVDEALRALTDDERKLMRRHFLDGETHQAIADELGIPRSTVAYRLTRLTQRVLETTRSRLVDAGLTPSALEVVLGAMRSHIDLSLSILRRA